MPRIRVNLCRRGWRDQHVSRTNSNRNVQEIEFNDGWGTRGQQVALTSVSRKMRLEKDLSDIWVLRLRTAAVIKKHYLVRAVLRDKKLSYSKEL